MARKKINGRVYDLPDDITDDEISQIMNEDSMKHGPSGSAFTNKPLSPNSSNMRSQLSGATEIKPATTADRFRNMIGRFVPEALTQAGSFGGAALGATAGGVPAVIGSGAGAGLGSAVGNLFRKVAPSLFGAPSETPLFDSATDALVSGILPEGAGRVAAKGLGLGLKFSPAVREVREADRISTMFNKARGFYEQSADRLPESTFTRDPNSAALDAITVTPNKTNPFSVAHNSGLEASETAMQKLMNTGYSPAKQTFNPHAVYDSLIKNPDSWKAIDPMTKNNFKEFLETAIKEKPLANQAHPILRMAGNRLVLGLGAALAGGVGAGAATAGGLIIGEAALRQLMKNPVTAHATIQALKTGEDSAAATLLRRVITYGMRLSEVGIKSPDSDEMLPGQVSGDGDVQYRQRSPK